MRDIAMSDAQNHYDADVSDILATQDRFPHLMEMVRSTLDAIIKDEALDGRMAGIVLAVGISTATMVLDLMERANPPAGLNMSEAEPTAK